MFDSMSAALIALGVTMFLIYLINRVVRQKVFQSHAERRIEIAFEAWEDALSLYGWKGKISRSLTGAEVDMEFSGSGANGQWMSVFGESGGGMFRIYGFTDDLAIAMDFEEAQRVGVLDALRVSRNTSHLAMLLDGQANIALQELPGLRAPGRTMTLAIDYGIDLDWSLPVDLWETHLELSVLDPVALSKHAMALKDALIGDGSTVETPTPDELLEVTRRGGKVAEVLAARTLLVLHAETSQTRTWIEENLKSNVKATRSWMGWLLEDLPGVDRGRAEWCSARALAIIQGDTRTGPELARHTREVADVYDVVSAAAEFIHAKHDGELEETRDARVARDAHLFACFMIASFEGESDPEVFDGVYGSLVGDVLQDYEVTIEFSELMGDLDDWHPALIAAALSHAGNDDVYGFWAEGIDEVWSPELAQRLLEVVQSEECRPGGLITIMRASARHRHIQMLGPARLAVSALNEHWRTDDDEKPEMREALKELETMMTKAQRDGGHLSLAVGSGGELSVSNPGAIGGGLEVSGEVVLDLDEEAAGIDVEEAQEVERGDAW